MNKKLPIFGCGCDESTSIEDVGNAGAMCKYCDKPYRVIEDHDIIEVFERLSHGRRVLLRKDSVEIHYAYVKMYSNEEVVLFGMASGFYDEDIRQRPTFYIIIDSGGMEIVDYEYPYTLIGKGFTRLDVDTTRAKRMMQSSIEKIWGRKT